MAIGGLKREGLARSEKVTAPIQTPVLLTLKNHYSDLAQTECMPVARRFLKGEVLHGTVATDHSIMSAGLLLHGFHIIVAMHSNNNNNDLH